jgi:hypothetical protein
MVLKEKHKLREKVWERECMHERRNVKEKECMREEWKCKKEE